MEIFVVPLIHIVIPALGLLLYYKLQDQMKKRGISAPPNKILFIIFVTYGGWLIVLLTTLFWHWSGAATIGLAYLVFLAPIVMLILTIHMFKQRGVSAFHLGAFIASAVYILIPIGILIFR
jgi:hypothetical protein